MVNVASARPFALSGAYGEMGFGHLYTYAMAPAVANSSSSVGGGYHYPCARWPETLFGLYPSTTVRSFLSVTAYAFALTNRRWYWGRTHARAKDIRSGRPFLLSNKLGQYDFPTHDAPSNSSASKVWMWVTNALADAAFTNAFGSWFAFAHVDTDRRRRGNGCFRNAVSRESVTPTVLRSFNPITYMPVLAPDALTQSQSDAT